MPPHPMAGPCLLETRMTKPTEKEIAAPAYKLWEDNGRPEGKEGEFWHAAEQALFSCLGL